MDGKLKNEKIKLKPSQHSYNTEKTKDFIKKY